MLKIENLTFRYGLRSAPVLQGVNIELQPGEIGIIMGKNGAGKTTLFKCILGIHRPTEGSVFFEGQDFFICRFYLKTISDTGRKRSANGSRAR